MTACSLGGVMNYALDMKNKNGINWSLTSSIFPPIQREWFNEPELKVHTWFFASINSLQPKENLMCARLS